MAKGDPRTSGGMGYFPGVYQSALAQTAQDYDSIMNQYKGLASDISQKSSSSSSQIPQFSPISPQFASPIEYTPGSDYSYLRDITETGGFKPGETSDIRERAISPIRSIYSSAQRGLQRQKSLQGGYSPNFGAVSSKMARDLSSSIGKQTTDVNAAIAEMQQKGRLTGATALAPLEAREADRRSEFQRTNAEIQRANAETANRFALLNQQMPLQFAQAARDAETSDVNRSMEPIRGQASLYGTTPALASTFGNQVMDAANIVSNFPPVKRSGGIGGIGVPSYGGIGGFRAGAGRG